MYVECAYDPEAEQRDIELTSHAGQELDIVVKGSLKIQIGSHTEVLHAGDTIYYDSSTPHGMIAVGGEDSIFYASSCISSKPRPLGLIECRNPFDQPNGPDGN